MKDLFIAGPLATGRMPQALLSRILARTLIARMRRSRRFRHL